MGPTHRRGPKSSEGSRLLCEIAKARGLNQEAIRREVEIARKARRKVSLARKSKKVSTGLVSRWLSGERGIELELATCVEVAYGIPPSAWATRPTKPERLPVSMPADPP